MILINQANGCGHQELTRLYWGSVDWAKNLAPELSFLLSMQVWKLDGTSKGSAEVRYLEGY